MNHCQQNISTAAGFIMTVTKSLHRFGLLAVGLGLAVNANSQSFLTNGLIAYYPLNGDANDASGNGNNGVVNGAILAFDRYGQPNTAYSFNGSNSYIRVAQPIITANPFTWTVWVKGTGDILTQGGNPGMTECSPALWVDGNGQCVFYSYANGPQQITCDVTPFYDANLWYALVGTSDAQGNRCLYVNGVCQATGTNQAFGQQLENFYMGGNVANLANWFTGCIDDVRIYNRALSASEVQELYQYELPPPRAATAAATVTNGFVVWATITDGGYGYTNTPGVRIIGGGGSGAEAVAVVTNGVVVAVDILGAGSGYTNAPVVVIAPPFIPQPTMAIAALFFGPLVAPVLELGLANLSPYDNYQLQFTPVAGGTWTNLGAAFTPTAATSTQYASAIGGAGFLRVKYVP
jgi:hypothetical protein